MSQQETIVKCQVSDGVATLTLNRAKHRNALSIALIQGLRDALRQAREDDAVRVVVLTGAGTQAFCAGGDLAGGMAGMAAGLPVQLDQKGAFVELVLELARLGKPSIAKLNGDAYGGGVGLLLACDLVVASDDVRIGLPEAKVGLWPMMVTALLVRHVGRKVAAELMLLGERLPAARALTLGLINRVVPRDELNTTVATMSATLASRSKAVLKLGLDALHQTADLPLEPALWSLRDRLALNTLLDDATEGITAFVQKRAPEWKDR